MKTAVGATPAYITRDGSEIRELMHPRVHRATLKVARQSLAEATVLPGQRTVLHRHAITEELYHVTGGSGVMTLGGQEFEVATGDTVCIPPGTAHCIANRGADKLTVLCACAPAYSHEDTELLE